MKRSLLMPLLILIGCTSPRPSQSIVVKGPEVLFVTQLLDAAKASDDALLISPLTEQGSYLLNRRGEILHRWNTGFINNHAKLGNDGLLYGLYRNPKMNLRRVGGLISVHSPEGKLIWSYEEPLLHHAIEPMPNGHVLGIKYSPLPEKQIQGVIKKSTLPPVCDEIIEISPEGKVVWNLPITNLIRVDQKYQGTTDPELLTSLNISEYCHTNSIRYYEKTIFSDRPAILISIRHLSLVLLIEKESKKVLWSSDGIYLLGQHDARLFGEKILVFNNNSVSSPDKNITRPSEILLINMKDGKTQKAFGQSEIMVQEWRSSYMSGATFLSNGNLLLTISGHSQVWELAPSGELVFKMTLISPRYYYELGSGLFTAEAYPLSFLKNYKLISESTN